MAALAGLCLFAGSVPAQVREWRAVVSQLSGNTTTCPPGGNPWIREGNGKFAGSVKGEAYSILSKSTLRVEVPAGTAPRAFQYLNATMACQYSVVPAS